MRETTSTMRLWTHALRRNSGAGDVAAAGAPLRRGPLQCVAASSDPVGEDAHAAIAAAAQQALFRRIREHIETHLASEQLDVAQLTETFGISRTHLCRLFEDAGGVANHIRTRRLETAVQRLADDPQCSITELLYALGFTSPRQFQRAFRSHFGMSPLQWREHCHGVEMGAAKRR